MLRLTRLISVLRIDSAYAEHAHSMLPWSKVKNNECGWVGCLHMINDYGSWIARRDMEFKREVHVCYVLDISKAQGLGTHDFSFRITFVSKNTHFDHFHEVVRHCECYG